MTFKNDLKKLITSVLDWWKEHEYDVDTIDCDDGYVEEYNRYFETPEFVKLAKNILKQIEKL